VLVGFTQYCTCLIFKIIVWILYYNFADDNGLNPIWRENCSVTFDITCPELALLRFLVQDEDVFGDPKFLGQATYPVTCLRSGINR
jgi:hypothetical protein